MAAGSHASPPACSVDGASPSGERESVSSPRESQCRPLVVQMRVASTAPSIELDAPTPGQDRPRLRLRGGWPLQYALAVRDLLLEAPPQPSGVDVRQVERLDSAGVLQLHHYARHNGLDFESFEFRPDHHAMVAAIEDVADERPKKKREL